MITNGWADFGEWSSVIALTLVHSLWQGVLIGLVVWMLLALLRRSSPRTRHTVCLLGLLSFAAVTVTTLTVLHQRGISDDRLSDDTSLASAPIADSGALSMAPEDIETTSVDGIAIASDTLEPSATTALPDPSITASEQTSLFPVVAANAPIVSAEATPSGSDWRSRIVEWSPWIVGFWLLGVFAIGGRSLGAWIAASRLKRIGTSPVPDQWQRRLDTLASRMGIDRAVQIFESTLVQAPVVIGWLKPTVLFPIGMLTGLTTQQVEAILAHELAHIRRHDFLINLIQTTIETLLFYHPVVWILSSRLRLEREQCCDDTAVEVSGGDRIHYAKTLCLLEERRSIDSFALSAGQKPLTRRIFRLLGDSPGAAKGRALLIFTIMLTMLLGANLWWQQAGAQDLQVESEPSPLDASLYLITTADKRVYHIWRVGFREGKVVQQERILTLDDKDQLLGYENQLVQQRYLVSDSGVIVDLEERRVVREAGEPIWKKLVGVTENVVMLRKFENVLEAFDLSNNTGKSLFNLGDTEGLRGARFSPNGQWLLQVTNDGFSRQLLRMEDRHAAKLDVQCLIQASDFSSSSYAPSPSLWLDNARVLFAKSNAQLVKATMDGKIEEIVEIPDLVPTALAHNIPLDYHLFRDAAGDVVFDAEGAGAFRIDVEQKRWEPYPRFNAGHGFSTEIFKNMVKRQEALQDDWVARYYGRNIGKFAIGRGLSKLEESRSVAAIEGYLAIVDANGFPHCWTAHEEDWQPLDKIAEDHLPTSGLLGWVDHRAQESARPEAPQPVPIPEKLVVHEWGVQVIGRSRVKKAWTMTGPSSDPQRMLGPSQELLDDMPAFVGRPESVATNFVSSGEWDKPVIHIYGEPGTEISIKVDTPTGVPFAYYPVPTVQTTPNSKMTFFDRMSHATVTLASSLEWRAILSAEELPLEPAPQGHWWNDLRGVPSRYLATANGNERFLFYEATAANQLPLDVQLEGTDLKFTWTAAPETRAEKNFYLRPIIICNDGSGGVLTNTGLLHWIEGESESVQLKSPTSGNRESTIDFCEGLWRDAGLTTAESRAIVSAWKPDLLETPGFQCIYMVPASYYNAMFPITIDPKPDELVRAGMVIRQIETAQGLPNLREKMLGMLGQLSEGTEPEIEQAKAGFRDLGAPGIAYLKENAHTVPAASALLDEWSNAERQQKRAFLKKSDQETTVPVGPEWFEQKYRRSREQSAHLSTDADSSFSITWVAHLRRFGDTTPDFGLSNNVQLTGWRDSAWEMATNYDVWWDERINSFRRVPGSRLRMMKLPQIKDFNAAYEKLQTDWASFQNTDTLHVDIDDFVAFFQPGAHEAIILSISTSGLARPLQIDENSVRVAYIDYQVHDTPSGRKLFHPGSWEDFDLDTFTEIEIPLVDPKAARPNRVGHLNTEVPGLGNLQIHLIESVPDWDSYTYREQDEYTYEVSSGESKTIIYPDREKPIWAINGARIWGSDGGGFTRKKLTDSVNKEWPITKLDRIELTINGQQFIAPEAATANIFLPRLKSKVLVSPDGKQIILDMAGSDGAGTYHMRWLFVNGEYRWRKGTQSEGGWE